MKEKKTNKPKATSPQQYLLYLLISSLLCSISPQAMSKNNDNYEQQREKLFQKAWREGNWDKATEMIESKKLCDQDYAPLEEKEETNEKAIYQLLKTKDQEHKLLKSYFRNNIKGNHLKKLTDYIVAVNDIRLLKDLLGSNGINETMMWTYIDKSQRKGFLKEYVSTISWLDMVLLAWYGSFYKYRSSMLEEYWVTLNEYAKEELITYIRKEWLYDQGRELYKKRNKIVIYFAVGTMGTWLIYRQCNKGSTATSMNPNITHEKAG